MQRHEDGTLVVSATDLVGFLECDHLVTLELARARGQIEKPFRDDPQLDLLRKRGYAHEQAEIARLTAAGRAVNEMQLRNPRTPAELRAAAAETIAAMQAGTDVIFQATVFDGRWRGHPDFLVRRDDRSSALGSWSYDVADTKLASHVKAAAILQMCVYADLLTRLQGTPPELLSVVTGDSATHPHRYDDYAAYYRSAKARFEARVFDPDDPAGPATYPEPVGHCDICPWWTMCMDRRRADDHLSIVAGAAKVQRRHLTDAGITTLAQLAEVPVDRKVPRLNPRILERLRRQAALQLDERVSHVPSYELIPPNPGDPAKGLTGLPEQSPLDVFFDLEADPLSMDGGLEYLFGWAEAGPSGEPEYHVTWAHDRAAEKAALEEFVDFVMERRERDPGMHVYHYGGYESGALKRLMQRHATREDEIDVLLRGRVLVNLYDHVVRQGIRASVESYSIKRLEVFYMPQREGGITNAGFSIVEYERWLESRSPEILEAIAAYNRDDCISNLRLRDWLEERRVEALGEHPEWYPDGFVPRPSTIDGEPPKDLAAAQAETRAREDRLRADLPVDRARRSDDEQATWLLAGVLDWHRREAKPQWWDWYRLSEASLEDLVNDPTALGELRHVEDRGRIARSIIRRYAFDPAQETKVSEGKTYLDPHAGTSVTVIAMDPLAGTVDLKLGTAAPHPAALIPGKPYGTEPMRSALGRLADDVVERGVASDGRFGAARDLLRRQPPRIRGLQAGAALMGPADAPTPTARRLGLGLANTILAIQGPPGTGKTYTAARMILDLVAEGRRIGVTAQSHRVIGNLLEAIVDAAAKEGRTVRIGQRTDDDGIDEGIPGVERIAKSEAVAPGLRRGTWDVVGGTAWLWAREDTEAAVDMLFVDEAGQFSLANTLAVSGAAGSVVLLGDPNQLPQVSQGAQPDAAKVSVLQHLLGSDETVPPERGIFLERTWRLRPEICAFTSEAYYEGRLFPAEVSARRTLAAGDGLGLEQPEHECRSQSSWEEADAVAEAIRALLGTSFSDDGIVRELGPSDFLVVAPYNAQVRRLRQRVPAGVRDGTVDKFQGQEAPVVLISMASSTAEDARRGIGFAFDRHRVNVATSRAQCRVVLVCAPRLLDADCKTVADMRLVNAVCRFVELAK